MRYQPHIDGLRAVAVLSVIFFHLDFAKFAGGFVGVDIFFVISGFLISSLIHAELLKTGEFRMGNFYLRRARRLMPALFTTISLTAIVAAVLFSSEQLKSFGTEAITGVLSVSNFLFWRQSGYFDVAAESKALLHLWSLSVEEQFYLVWPLTLVLGYKFLSPRSLIVGITAIALLSLLTTVTFTNHEVGGLHNQSQALFFLTPFRVYEFMLGALGIWLTKKTPSNVYIQELMFLIGGAAVVWSISQFSKETVFPYYNALAPCIGALLLILSGGSKLSKLVLANGLSVYIGLLSYTLYLVHWPVIVFVKHMYFGQLTTVATWSILVTTVLITLVIYYCVEQPLRQTPKSGIQETKVSRHTNKIFVTKCIGAGVFIIFLGSLFFASSGLALFKNELYPEDIVSKGKSNRYSLIRKSCRIDDLNSPSCQLDRPIQILVYGNSHVPDGYNIFHRLTSENDQVNLILFGSTNHCKIRVDEHGHIQSNIKRNNCNERTARLNDAALIDSIDIIVYSSNRPFAGNKKSSWSLLSNLTKKNENIELIVLGSYFNTRLACAQIANRLNGPDACKDPKFVSYAGNNEQNSASAKKIKLDTNYLYMSKFEVLCDIKSSSFNSCVTAANNEPMFYDTHHLSMGFALYLGDKFSSYYVDELKALGL